MTCPPTIIKIHHLDWIKDVFNQVHNLFYPLISNTKKLVAMKFIWRGLKKDVGAWARQMYTLPVIQDSYLCLVSGRTILGTQSLNWIQPCGHRRTIVSIRSVHTHTHTFTSIYWFSHWPEAILRKNTTTTSCMQLCFNEMFISKSFQTYCQTGALLIKAK